MKYLFKHNSKKKSAIEVAQMYAIRRWFVGMKRK